MTFFASILLFAATRAEMVDRLSAMPTIVSDGLVKVVPDCPSDMRREFQTPIARFAADTVDYLYRGLAIKREKFSSPGIYIYIGDGRTNNTEVISRFKSSSVRVYLPAPGYSDIDKLRLEVVKGFAISVMKDKLDDDAALRLYRKADPMLRAEDEQSDLRRWINGEVELETEEGLKLMRKVFIPGQSVRMDSEIFASRLMLYPPYHACPFCGKYLSLGFEDAIEKSRSDPAIRIAALEKSYSVMVYGGGKGLALSKAAEAYRDFLLALAAGTKSPTELRTLLKKADRLLKESSNEKDDNR